MLFLPFQLRNSSGAGICRLANRRVGIFVVLDTLVSHTKQFTFTRTLVINPTHIYYSVIQINWMHMQAQTYLELFIISEIDFAFCLNDHSYTKNVFY